MISMKQIFEVDEKGKRETIPDLISVLSDASEKVLNHELARTLIDYYYEVNFQNIKKYGFYPFFVYFAATAINLSCFIILSPSDDSNLSDF